MQIPSKALALPPFSRVENNKGFSAAAALGAAHLEPVQLVFQRREASQQHLKVLGRRLGEQEGCKSYELPHK